MIVQRVKRNLRIGSENMPNETTPKAKISEDQILRSLKQVLINTLIYTVKKSGNDINPEQAENLLIRIAVEITKKRASNIIVPQ